MNLKQNHYSRRALALLQKKAQKEKKRREKAPLP